MELDKLRYEICNLDKEIVRLLEKRFNKVIEIGHYKRKNNLPIFDEEREKRVVENCISFLENKDYSKYIDDIYFQIMRTCKDIQNNIIKE
ncbi:MAG TPA: chorismate mutase [Tissierellia bacterium]|jgi:monofunctional chorismate mutase|nr:chorismate mutase [Tissierellia bacterium]